MSDSRSPEEVVYTPLTCQGRVCAEKKSGLHLLMLQMGQPISKKKKKTLRELISPQRIRTFRRPYTSPRRPGLSVDGGLETHMAPVFMVVGWPPRGRQRIAASIATFVSRQSLETAHTCPSTSHPAVATRFSLHSPAPTPGLSGPIEGGGGGGVRAGD